MSHSEFAHAFDTHEANYRARVLEETWGHLAPKENKTYRGHIIFADSVFQNEVCVLECEFGKLDSSPWFYDALMEFLHAAEHKPGTVWRWDGTFRNYQFTGKIRQLTLT